MKNIFTVLLIAAQHLLCAQGAYNVYFGNLHSHTSNSDGSGEPSDAFQYAQYSAGLHFLAVTDHVEQIDPLEWYYVKSDANSATVDGQFIGIAGWEWGSPLYGHINVFNTNDYITDAGNLWYTLDFPAFINWVNNHSPAFGQFNHPGDEETFNNWNDFEYISSATDNLFPLIEFQNIQQATDWYEFALAKGWHVSPVWNQDNHSPDWGTKNDGRAGIWASSLTKNDLFSAMQAGRTFATMDKNASVWIDLDGQNMGGSTAIQSVMQLHINLQDTDNEQWTQIEIVTKNGVVNNLGPAGGNYETTIPVSFTDDEWVFLRAVQADGDYIWSAPVYISGILPVTSVNSDDKYFKIYPNPARDFLNVEFFSKHEKPVSLTVIDINGRIIGNHVLGNQQNTIDTRNLSKGIYTLRIQNIFYCNFMISK